MNRFAFPRPVVVVLVGAVLIGLIALFWPRTPQSLHIRTAQIVSFNIAAKSAPSRSADMRQLNGAWRHIFLPYAPSKPITFGIDVTKAPSAAMQETWLRLAAPPEKDLHRPLYMYIPRWKSDGQIAIYTDGRLTYQSHANDKWNGANQPLWVPLEDTAEAQTPHVFLVRLQHTQGDVGFSSVWVGNYGTLTWQYLIRYFLVVLFPAVSSGGLLVTGLFSFLVWVRRRNERMYFIFFLLSVAAFIQTLHVYFGHDRLPISDAWFSWVTANSAMWMVGLIQLLLVEVHGKRRAHLTLTIWAAAAFWTIICFPAAPILDPDLNAPLIYLSAFIAALAVCASGLLWSWRHRVREGFWLAGCVFVSIIFGIHDGLLENNLINIGGIFLSLYFNFIITLVFRRIMLSHFVGALTTAEKANEHLAEQLRMRERELTESYERLRLTEQRQLLINERQRVMQDMHDGMGSSLVSAVRAVEHGNLDEARIVQVLKDCIDDLKLTIDAMEPTEADLLLLLATLRFRLQPRLDSTGLKLVWQVQDVPPISWLDQHCSLHILRILQEAFTNIIKHAKASEILVATAVENGQVLITITDNGQGFNTEKTAPRGKGVGNQTRRAKAIGGTVSWQSSPSGTCFSLSLPVEQPTSPHQLPHSFKA